MSCRGCRQRFLPLPDLSRKKEGDSVRRVPIRVIAVGFDYSIRTRRRLNSHSKCTVRVSTSFRSLLHAERTSTVAIASK